MERMRIWNRIKGLWMTQRRRAARNGPGPGGELPAAWREGERPARRESGETRLTDRYSRDLTQLAAQGELDPLIGRDREVPKSFVNSLALIRTIVGSVINLTPIFLISGGIVAENKSVCRSAGV